MPDFPYPSGDPKDWFAPVKTDQPIRGMRADSVIVDEVHDPVDEGETPAIDEQELYRASILYYKNNKVSEKDASDYLRQNPHLIKEWANKTRKDVK
jgi:hypothetical protein